MFKLNLNPFYYPDMPAGTLPVGTGKEDIIKFLGEDESKEEAIPLKEPKSDKDEVEDEEELETKSSDKEEKEGDELSDLEEELEGPTEEQLELMTPVRRKEILSKYPKLFKDFPYLERAYYREQQFTELLPTIDDAKQAVADSQTLANFEKDVIGGNTETILKSIKDTNPESFNRVVDNYMNTLAKVDERAYHHVIGNLIKHTIMEMVTESRGNNNEDLMKAAGELQKFVFGKTQFEPPSKLASDKPDTKTDELSEREQKFAQQQLDRSVEELNTRVNGAYRSTIEANIDPRQTMSDYVRKTASRDALENLETLMSQDKRFSILVDKLWERASDEDFSKASIDRIKTAFVSKARTLLPSVIKKARIEALRGMGKRVTDDTNEEESTIKESTPRKGPSKREDKPSSHSGGKSKEVPKGMSTLEFLMSDD